MLNVYHEALDMSRVVSWMDLGVKAGDKAKTIVKWPTQANVSFRVFCVCQTVSLKSWQNLHLSLNGCVIQNHLFIPGDYIQGKRAGKLILCFALFTSIASPFRKIHIHPHNQLQHWKTAQSVEQIPHSSGILWVLGIHQRCIGKINVCKHARWHCVTQGLHINQSPTTRTAYTVWTIRRGMTNVSSVIWHGFSLQLLKF